VGLSGDLQGAGGIGGMLARTDMGLWAGAAERAHALYHSDGNGNVTALINVDQSVVAKYEYDPYGNILNKIGILADANLYRFSSKEYHQASGLIYYCYRYYDPSSQRWLNRDLLCDLMSFHSLISSENIIYAPQGELVAGPNLYTFVRSDSVDVVDSNGLMPSSVHPGSHPKPPPPPAPKPCPDPCAKERDDYDDACTEADVACGGAALLWESGPPGVFLGIGCLDTYLKTIKTGKVLAKCRSEHPTPPVAPPNKKPPITKHI
jgi:RHS repeat-associated protein